ncbi:MAG: glycerol-3-phosphate 1-O-acyltransferase PlsY [Acidobacteriia bacterium]|nr:glycerol-3-phosphate 1-O-acyltransferase PlsY [Terriglobia bacterium]
MNLPAILAIVLAYLFGAIPFGYIIVKTKLGKDVRNSGSGSTGATNVLRTAGTVGGILTFALDVGKGSAAVLVAKALSPANDWIVAIAAVSAILGHIFPVFLKFKGGKGVATGVGVYLAILPQAVGAVLVIFFFVVLLSRYISLGSIIATSAFPFFAYGMGRNSLSFPIIVGTFVGALLIVVMHRQNIRRIASGTENKFKGFSSRKS